MTCQLIQGDCLEKLKELEAGTAHTCITSPPYYGLRDYGVSGQIGLESTPTEYVEKLVAVFREVRRVLRDDGTVWLNLGDSFNSAASNQNGKGLDGSIRSGNQARGRNNHTWPGLKPKDLLGIPWRVAFALQADGWYLRSDIIWHKPNPMPESVTDRPTKAHEYLFLLSKRKRYYYDGDAIKEPSVDSWNPKKGFGTLRRKADQLTPTQLRFQRTQFAHDTHHDDIDKTGRNRRTVWTVATKPFKGAHFATFPPKLIEPCVLAGCPEGGTVLDPFAGAGTTGLVAIQHNRNFIGIELNAEYIRMARRRIRAAVPQPELVAA